MKYFKSGKYNRKQVKDQYRRLAMQYHPDKGGTVEQFQEVSKEYEALLNRFKSNAKTDAQKEDIQDDINHLDQLLNAMGLKNELHRRMAKSIIKMGGDALVKYIKDKSQL